MASRPTKTNESSKGSSSDIVIISYEEMKEKGSDRTLAGPSSSRWFGLAPRRTTVKPEVFKDSLKSFFQSMSAGLHGVEAEFSSFTLEELEIEVEVSAEGEVRLLGSGAKVGGKGSLTLKLRRKKPNSD